VTLFTATSAVGECEPDRLGWSFIDAMNCTSSTARAAPYEGYDQIELLSANHGH